MRKIAKFLLPIMFVLYLIALVWCIVFKANRDLLIYGGEPEYRQISFSLYFNGSETLLNIATFVPTGLFLMLLLHENKPLSALSSLALSFSFEVAQYIFMLGTSDLTDLISNTLGGIVGIATFMFCKRLLHDKTNDVLSWLCIPATLAFCYIAVYLV